LYNYNIGGAKTGFVLQIFVLGWAAIMAESSERRWRLGLILALAVVGLLLVGGKLRSQGDVVSRSVSGGGENIMVVPVQLGRDSYGLAMVDTVGKTLWLYDVSSRGSARGGLRLLAARSWEYDRLLSDYNVGEPRPGQVRDILERINAAQQKERESTESELEEEAGP
jgi:hypothetical protein